MSHHRCEECLSKGEHMPTCSQVGPGYTFGHKVPHPVLAKYGLETMAGDPLEILDRHLTNNRAATDGAWKHALDTMYKRYEELYDVGNVAYGALLHYVSKDTPVMKEFDAKLNEAKALILVKDIAKYKDKLKEDIRAR